jgi:D-alanine--poly(phosphoribitol) ligase subunit 2
MQSRDAMVQALSSFIRERFQVPASDKNFTPQVHLWNEGYVDSLGAAEVIAFIEGTFEVKLPEDTFFDERNMTIDGLIALVGKLRGNA